jgi:hypothetical protein
MNNAAPDAGAAEKGVGAGSTLSSDDTAGIIGTARSLPGECGRFVSGCFDVVQSRALRFKRGALACSFHRRAEVLI